MAVREHLDSQTLRRLQAGLVSVVLHVGLFLAVALSGGRYEGVDAGETPITQLVMIEARTADQRDGTRQPPLEAAVAEMELQREVGEDSAPPEPLPGEIPTESLAHLEPDAALSATVEDIEMQADPSPVDAIDQPSTYVMPAAQRSALQHRLEQLAEDLANTPETKVTWEEDGKHYSARLVLERASDGLEFDRVVADVSAEDSGRRLKTHIRFKRLAFSHFTQMIDRWDPTVQLHDDEIVGRFHVNSQFNVLFEGRKGPKFLGKVTTAASGFNAQANGRRREADMFQGGFETRVSRIVLPEEVQPFAWAPREDNARIHELENDTHIRFFADGSYTWRDERTEQTQYRNDPSDEPVYFVAKPGAVVHVQGVVRGKVLVYSPSRIVIEGNLTYANDPRRVPDSRDYLGLVSGRYVDIAGPAVTGPGDLEVHAAIFAGRRFVVRDEEHPRTATLHIYGSLAAGSITASEPRYSTRIEYDPRLEELRPPGFPSTNRFAAEDWDGVWQETPEQVATGVF